MTGTESRPERNKIYPGNALKVLKTFRSKTIDCCITSPPYWGLRNYGTDIWIGGNPDCDHVKSGGGHLKDSITSIRGGANKVNESQSVLYEDVCKKCGARKAGEIWDGDPGCDHEFGQEQKAFKSSQPTKWNTSAPEIWSGGWSSFCTKCGAWQGSLGLEPDYNLYVEHLCQIFDEVKRTLKPDGSLWVNIGDTYSGAPVSGKQGGFQGKFSRDKSEISNVKKPSLEHR